MKQKILEFLIAAGQRLVSACGNALHKANEAVHKDDGSIDPKGVAKVAAVSLLGVGAAIGIWLVLSKVLYALFVFAVLAALFFGDDISTWMSRNRPPQVNMPAHMNDNFNGVWNTLYQAAYELRKVGILPFLALSRLEDVVMQWVSLNGAHQYQVVIPISGLPDASDHWIKARFQDKLLSLLRAGEVLGARSVCSPFDCNLPLLVVTGVRVYDQYIELYVVMTDTWAEYLVGKAAYMRSRMSNSPINDPQDPLI